MLLSVAGRVARAVAQARTRVRREPPFKAPALIDCPYRFQSSTPERLILPPGAVSSTWACSPDSEMHRATGNGCGYQN